MVRLEYVQMDCLLPVSEEWCHHQVFFFRIILPVVLSFKSELSVCPVVSNPYKKSESNILKTARVSR